jgi:hypothetical protein
LDQETEKDANVQRDLDYREEEEEKQEEELMIEKDTEGDFYICFKIISGICLEVLRKFLKVCRASLRADKHTNRPHEYEVEGIICVTEYRVIHKSVKHFKISQQINYASDRGNSYADRE